MNDDFRGVKDRIRRLDGLLEGSGSTNVELAQAVSRVRRLEKKGDRSRKPTAELQSLLEKAESLAAASRRD